MSFYLSIIAIQPPIDLGVINLRSVHSTNYRALVNGNGTNKVDLPDISLDMANYISTNTILNIGYDLFIGSAVDIPQNKSVALIKLTGGYTNRQAHNDSKIFRPTFQILTFGGDYDDSYNLAKIIYNLLDGKHNLTI
jgi:hypothetical protein